jgi:hypothetical protein
MAHRRRRPWGWLVVAALLLALGAWLMRGAEPPARPEPERVSMPTRATRRELQQVEQRRTWVPVVSPDGGAPSLDEARPRDPVLALMPTEVKRGAVVGEYNALINSELGARLTECMFGGAGARSRLEELKDGGLDPINGIDRVAFVDDAFMLTGNFRGARWKELFGAEVVKDYGRNGQLFESTLSDGGTDVFATWGGQLMLAGASEAVLKDTLDRLDGRARMSGRPVVDESMAYGELYGVLAPSTVADLLREADPKVAELLLDSVKDVELHADLGHDLGLVADVRPRSAAQAEELRRALGGGLSLARAAAVAKGQQDVAQLLDLASVGGAGSSGGFRLEAGVPHDFMVKMLDECIARRRREASAATDDDDGQ